LLICESGDKKDTLGGLANLNSQANEAIKILTKLNPLFDIKLAQIETINEQVKKLPKRLHAIYEAAVKNHQITLEAAALINSGKSDYKTLGQLMSDHHLVLKELLQITTPKIDRIVDAANNAGAMGAKIIGSGGGGCVCILCEDSKKDAILEVLNDQINAKSYEVLISDGAHTLNL
jgi:galactokinase